MTAKVQNPQFTHYDGVHKFAMFGETNNLNNFYNKDDSDFKKKIDKLNFKFYLETDRFLNFKTEIEKSQDNLFLYLFKQVSLYIEEIEKLNYKLREKEEQEKQNKNKIEVYKKEIYEKEINLYKNTVKELERKINNKTNKEEQLRKENESFRRQILFYQEKLKMDLTHHHSSSIKVKVPAKSPTPTLRKMVRFNDNLTTRKDDQLDSSISNNATPQKSSAELKIAYKNAKRKQRTHSDVNKEIITISDTKVTIITNL
jgi:hypothetical protein